VRSTCAGGTIHRGEREDLEDKLVESRGGRRKASARSNIERDVVTGDRQFHLARVWSKHGRRHFHAAWLTPRPFSGNVSLSIGKQASSSFQSICCFILQSRESYRYSSASSIRVIRRVTRTVIVMNVDCTCRHLQPALSSEGTIQKYRNLRQGAVTQNVIPRQRDLWQDALIGVSANYLLGSCHGPRCECPGLSRSTCCAQGPGPALALAPQAADAR
jgi:hypothetical protein